MWPGALLSPGQPILIPHTVAAALPRCLLPPGWSRRIMSPGDQGSRATSGSSDSTPWTPNSTGAKTCVHTGICPDCSYQPVHVDEKWKPSHGAVNTRADNTWPIQSVERSSDMGHQVAVPASWFSDGATYCVILSIVNVQSGQMCRPVRTRARRGVPMNGFPLGDGGTAL